MASATELAAQAATAFLDDDLEEAADLYSKALAVDSRNAGLYESRAQVFLKQEKWLEGLQDCNNALQLDPASSKAFFRKGVALFEMEEYEDALEVLEEGQKTDPGNKFKFGQWISKCKKNISGSDDAPEVKQTSATSAQPPRPAVPSASQQQSAPAVSYPPDMRDKYRHQWFQTQDVVEIAVLAKDMTQEQVSVDIEDRKVQVVIRSPEGEEVYKLVADLYAKVDPNRSLFEIFKSKVELRLRKAEGVQWPTLEVSDKVVSSNYSTADGPPANVYTSRKKNINWDQLESELKIEEKNEKPEGEAGLQKLFREIYGGADEDTRRAMNKSYQESNGTVLSTNWKEVGSKKIEFIPPKSTPAKAVEH